MSEKAISNTSDTLKKDDHSYASECDDARVATDFMRLLTHEIRTPLSVFKAVVDNIRDGVHGKVGKNLKRDIQFANLAISRLKNIIDSYEKLKQLENGDYIFDMKPVSIREIVEIAEKFDYENTEVNNRIFFSFVDSNLRGFADKECLLAVLFILIDNSIKHSKSDPKIFVKAEDKGDEVFFTVHDQGVGISPICQDKVFEKFYRCDEISGSSDHGIGLGLAMAKEFIVRQGGDIWLDQNQEKGACFKFSISKYDSQIPIKARGQYIKL